MKPDKSWWSNPNISRRAQSICGEHTPPILTRKGLFLPGWARRGHGVAHGFLNPTGSPSLDQFPGDTYSNMWKLSEGLRRLTRGRDRYGGENLKLSGQGDGDSNRIFFTASPVARA